MFTCEFSSTPFGRIKYDVKYWNIPNFDFLFSYLQHWKKKLQKTHLSQTVILRVILFFHLKKVDFVNFGHVLSDFAPLATVFTKSRFKDSKADYNLQSRASFPIKHIRHCVLIWENNKTVVLLSAMIFFLFICFQ